MLYLILWNDAQLNLKDIKKECEEEGWVPVLVYRPRGQPDAIPTVVAFTTGEMAQTFVRRNVSRRQQSQGYYRGAVQVSQKTVEWIRAKGWEIDIKTWPHKMVDNPKWDLGLEIVELQEDRQDRGTMVSHGGLDQMRPI